MYELTVCHSPGYNLHRHDRIRQLQSSWIKMEILSISFRLTTHAHIFPAWSCLSTRSNCSWPSEVIREGQQGTFLHLSEWFSHSPLKETATWLSSALQVTQFQRGPSISIPHSMEDLSPPYIQVLAIHFWGTGSSSPLHLALPHWVKLTSSLTDFTSVKKDREKMNH